MAKKIYYEDVAIDDALPSLVRRPTRRQLVMWASVAGEFSEMHYDDNFARSKGFPGIIVHGMLAASFLAQMVTDWMGIDGTLKKLKTSNRQFMLVDDEITCKGHVIRKYVQEGDQYVECELRVEGAGGVEHVLGSAVLTLPSRKSGLSA